MCLTTSKNNFSDINQQKENIEKEGVQEKPEFRFLPEKCYLCTIKIFTHKGKLVLLIIKTSSIQMNILKSGGGVIIA